MMKKTTYVAVLLTMVLTCMFPAGAKTRRALVIGLGEQLDPSWGKINGDRDVPLVVGMLGENGFGDIATLTNSKATKAAIVKAFDALIRRSGKGDIVYIHFSGHGQLMTDMDGDEDDGLDESWIPYDAYLQYCPQDRGDKHLCDDEIARHLARLRAKVGEDGAIAVVVDACHSGYSTRNDAELPDSLVVRGVDVDFVIPGKRTKTGRAAAESWLTLSACTDIQLNQEYRGVGKLTHILTNNWHAFAGHSDRAIFNAIGKAYESRRYKGPFAQNPHMSGESGRVLSKIFDKE